MRIAGIVRMGRLCGSLIPGTETVKVTWVSAALR